MLILPSICLTFLLFPDDKNYDKPRKVRSNCHLQERAPGTRRSASGGGLSSLAAAFRIACSACTYIHRASGSCPACASTVCSDRILSLP